MQSNSNKKMGTLSVLSIGIGGMVGGGIFAVTGLAIELTKGAVPIAFILAGIVALLTSYSYLKLTLAYPSSGGTSKFLIEGFGIGIFSGALNILLLISYMVLLSVYAYAFGSYFATFFSTTNSFFIAKLSASIILVLLITLNTFGTNLVLKSENMLNVIKMILLFIFIIVGFSTPVELSRLSPQDYVPALQILSGAMIIFLNYEGFELIANASPEIKNPKKSLPIAYIGGVLIVIVLYVLIVSVVLGHLEVDEVIAHSDYSLTFAAHSFMGEYGIIITIAALLATSSAMNATFYSSSRLTNYIAKSQELPKELERNIKGMPLEGMYVFGLIALLMVNFLNLNAIATMGSAGFLLIFLAVNIVNVKKAKETNSNIWLSLAGVFACTIALVALCWQVWSVQETRPHIWILLGMIIFSFLVEATYMKMRKK